MTESTDKLVIAGTEFTSRLMVGTGKYDSFQQITTGVTVGRQFQPECALISE